MSLSENTIQELREILQESYGRELDTSEASKTAYKLVEYFDLLGSIYQREIKNEHENN